MQYIYFNALFIWFIIDIILFKSAQLFCNPNLLECIFISLSVILFQLSKKNTKNWVIRLSRWPGHLSSTVDQVS